MSEPSLLDAQHLLELVRQHTEAESVQYDLHLAFQVQSHIGSRLNSTCISCHLMQS